MYMGLKCPRLKVGSYEYLKDTLLAGTKLANYKQIANSSTREIIFGGNFFA
jgi:hypothetical protein